MAKRSIIGLDIGSAAVAAAEVTVTRNDVELTHFGGVALPQGAVHEGEIVDIDGVADTIRELWSDHKFRGKKVVLGAANQRVVVRQVDINKMEDEELRNALMFQAQEHIPIPVDDALLDFQVLEEFEGAEGDMYRTLLVAAHRDMVGSHVAAAKQAGLRPVGVDLNPFAVLRSLAPKATASGRELLIDIGSGVTDLVVHDNGVPKFVRILPTGGNDITEAVNSGMGLTLDAAEAEKVRVGMSTDPTEEAGEHIREYVGYFIEEIRSSLDFYLAQSGTTAPDRVVLAGGGAKLQGLPEALQTSLQVPVVLGQPLERLQLETVLRPDELSEVEPVLTCAVGLALGGLS